MAKLKLLDASQGRPKLDRYELIGELASGGMATVYLARLSGLGGFQRFVAIKRLHPHLANEQDFVEMFLDEARLSAGIHHPNAVSILEVGTSDLGYYLVMEYIEGDTLSNLRRRAEQLSESIPIKIGLRICIDALAGLHAAHELRDENRQLVKLVHRDVSPQNILVGVDGTARISDFGVAKASSRLNSTRSGEIKGKLAYMAPEQIKGGELDRRTDIFAAGVVIWEILANKPLFQGGNDAVTMNRVLNEPVPDLCGANPRVPAAVRDVVHRALDRDPERRYATCLELANDLENAAKSRMGIASPTEVAAYVERLLAERLSSQRAAVGEWLSSTNSAKFVPIGSAEFRPARASGPVTSSSPPSKRPPGPPPPSRRAPATPSQAPASGPQPLGVIAVEEVAVPLGVAPPAPVPPNPMSGGWPVYDPVTGQSGTYGSAVLPAPAPVPPPEPKKSNTALLVAGVSGLMLLVGVGAWLSGRATAQEGAPSLPHGPVPMASSSERAAATASAAPSATASQAPVATASASVEAPKKAVPGPLHAPAGKGPKPAKGAGGDDDDMANNPYHR